MSQLIVKDVEFNGSIIKAAQDHNTIYVGVRWICEGLGLSEGQVKRERKRLNEDLVLKQGGRNLILPTNGGNQEVLCLILEFLPLWIAKINPTPKMKKENPELVDKLITYQLKAKDVLAKAFLNKQEILVKDNVIEMLHTQQEELQNTKALVEKLYKDMSTFSKLMLDHSYGSSLIEIDNGKGEQQKWKQSVYTKIDVVLLGTDFTNRSDVLKYIYNYMTKNYSIVWDQEKKEYYNANSKWIRTIDLIYEKDMLRSIFEAILTDLTYKTKRIPMSYENDMCAIQSIDQIISPLIEKYQDKSNAGMVTYMRVYKQMESIRKIGWKNLTTRHIKKYGNKPSKKELIESRPVLLRQFKRAVNDLMALQ